MAAEETDARHRKELTHSTSSRSPHCTPFTLPSGGHLSLNPTSTITFSNNVVFTPECAASAAFAKLDGISSVTDVKDPFHASVTPQVYATGAATVIAWMLVVMLLITPRTFFVGGVGGGVGLLGRRGMISGAQGSASVIGVGSRPWLQKVAALTVAISLTIATADTFQVAERQYATGFMNAEALRIEVVSSTQIKISRVISDIFLWLAQVQTLIRLFPRHKEKVLIKWIGFALIILDSTFSCLNSFMSPHTSRPRRFRDAIPALSYLFQLALSMLYAAWVIYYAICKRRYAFYHSSMWNVSVVAGLSLIAISTPVVFFITDISNASVAGWGDYFRWVGAAAASVIVWEWVERIEALERDEKKDGILGREVFDGEDTDSTDNDVISWPRHRRGAKRFWTKSESRYGNDTAFTSSAEELGHGRKMAYKAAQLQASHTSVEKQTAIEQAISPRRLSRVKESDSEVAPRPHHMTVPTPPPVAVSPISRSDTTSAASTVYTVRYHTLNLATPPVSRLVQFQEARQGQQSQPNKDANEKDVADVEADEALQDPNQSKGRWHTINNPFKRKRVLAPAEVRQGQVIDPVAIGTSSKQQPIHNYHPWDIKGRLGALAAEHGERWRERTNRQQTEVDLPVTIIPAQPRGEPVSRPWSPEGSSTAGRPNSTAALVPDKSAPVTSSSMASTRVEGESQTTKESDRSMSPTIVVSSAEDRSSAPTTPATTPSPPREEPPRRPEGG